MYFLNLSSQQVPYIQIVNRGMIQDFDGTCYEIFELGTSFPTIDHHRQEHDVVNDL